MASQKSPPVRPPPLQLLLVGGKKDGHLHLRRMLSNSAGDKVCLEYAESYEEAVARLKNKRYDLLLYGDAARSADRPRLLNEFRSVAPHVPLIFLCEHENQVEVLAAITVHTPKLPGLDQATLLGIVSCTISLYCNERQRLQGEETLRNLWQAVEQSADMILITDRTGVIEYVNPAFETLTGYSREEAIGQTPRLLKSGHQTPELYQQLWQAICAGEVFRGVLLNRKKSGEIYYVEKSITPVRDAQGEITHFISNDRDITERRRLESQLLQAQKMDAIGKLAGGVAHDFNNLLMVISAYAELMFDALAPDHPLRRNVNEIMSASRRAADLTRQLLAFGRKQMQALQVLDLNVVIGEINKMLPRLIGEDIELVFAPEANLGRVKADRVQIEQVMMNLSANARDAMPHGGRLTITTATVELSEAYVQQHKVVPAGEYVLLTVSDTGDGITPEHMAHIFEPFYSTKEEGKGTGLGLATVYGIVKQSGGYIWVYSEPGLGTTFKIYLPRVHKETGEVPVVKPAEPCARGSETLLLVEDEETVRQPAREFLNLNGYVVLEAKDGEDAIRFAGDYGGPIDLMITDVVMPHMGGAQLAEHLKLTRPEMKVLFVSGYAESTIVQHGEIDMVTRFLQKPFSLKALARKIRDVLETKASAAAN